MRVDIPELKRCCFCLPLRHGLLFWIYMKLVLSVLLVCYFTFVLITIISRRLEVFPCVVLSTTVIVFLIDIAFCILFIISAHRKQHEYMRIYYKYAVVMFILGVLATLALIGMEIYVAVISMPYTIFLVQYMMQYTCGLFVDLVLHAYLIVLVRSELVKLENGAKFEFINHTNEAECKVEIKM